MPKFNRELENLAQFATCKKQICYKLIGSEQNKDMLNNVPNMPVIDGLRAVFYVRFSSHEIVTITNDLVKLWNIPSETAVPVLYRHASENTEYLKPVELKSLTEAILGVARLEDIPEYRALTPKEQKEVREHAASQNEFFVLTTTDSFFGASAILYKNGRQLTDALQKISRRTGNKTNAAYILPSSIHEVLIVPDTGCFTPETLQGMVQSVNFSHVKPEEVLNNQIYHYDCQNGLKSVDVISKQRMVFWQDINR